MLTPHKCGQAFEEGFHGALEKTSSYRDAALYGLLRGATLGVPIGLWTEYFGKPPEEREYLRGALYGGLGGAGLGVGFHTGLEGLKGLWGAGSSPYSLSESDSGVPVVPERELARAKAQAEQNLESVD